MSYYFISTRVAIIKMTDNKGLGGWRETGTLVCCWWEHENGTATVWSFFKLLNIELVYNPNNST